MPPQQTPKGKRQRHCCSLPPHALVPPTASAAVRRCSDSSYCCSSAPHLPGHCSHPCNTAAVVSAPLTTSPSAGACAAVHTAPILWLPLPPLQHKTSQCCKLHPNPTPHGCCCCGRQHNPPPVCQLPPPQHSSYMKQSSCAHRNLAPVLQPANPGRLAIAVAAPTQTKPGVPLPLPRSHQHTPPPPPAYAAAAAAAAITQPTFAIAAVTPPPPPPHTQLLSVPMDNQCCRPVSPLLLFCGRHRCRNTNQSDVAASSHAHGSCCCCLHAASKRVDRGMAIHGRCCGCPTTTLGLPHQIPHSRRGDLQPHPLHCLVQHREQNPPPLPP